MREGEMSCRVLAAAAVAFEVAALSAGAMPLFTIRITSFAACALDLCLKRLTRLGIGVRLGQVLFERLRNAVAELTVELDLFFADSLETLLQFKQRLTSLWADKSILDESIRHPRGI